MYRKTTRCRLATSNYQTVSHQLLSQQAVLFGKVFDEWMHLLCNSFEVLLVLPATYLL